MEKREKFTVFKPEALAKRTGLAYIPLYSPSAKPKSHVQPFTCDSSATHQIKTSHESQSLLAKESSVTEDSSSEDLSDHGGAFYSFIPKRTTTSFSEFLKLPEHPSKISTQHQKSTGSILTSVEFREKMENSKKEKLEKEYKKRQQKIERERKKQQRDKIGKLKKSIGRKKHPASFKKVTTRKSKSFKDSCTVASI